MIFSEVQEFIASREPIESLLSGRHFWDSEQKIFIRTAAILREKGRFKEAIGLIESTMEKQGLTSSKTRSLLLHIKADCFLDQRKFTEAISVYDVILSKVQDSTAYANRGLGYWELQKYDLALKDYLCAVRLTPNDAVAQRSVGELLNKLDKHSQAVRHLRKSIQIDPGSSKAYCELGISYYALNDWLKAYRSLKKAFKLDPTNSVAELGIRKIEDHFDLSK